MQSGITPILSVIAVTGALMGHAARAEDITPEKMGAAAASALSLFKQKHADAAVSLKVTRNNDGTAGVIIKYRPASHDMPEGSDPNSEPVVKAALYQCHMHESDEPSAPVLDCHEIVPIRRGRPPGKK